MCWCIIALLICVLCCVLNSYGYVTTTNVKLIIVVDEYSEIKDSDVKTVRLFLD